jgi:arylsulfatase A-like enzyme
MDLLSQDVKALSFDGEAPEHLPSECTPEAIDVRRPAFVMMFGVLLIFVWFGLFAGGVEAIYWLIKQFVFGDLVFMHPGYFWIAPLATLLICLVPGICLGAVAWLDRSPRILPIAVTVAAFIAWLNTIELVMPGLLLWAGILLAGGLATASGRIFRRYPRGCLAIFSRTVVAMVVVLIGASIGQELLQRRQAARASAALPVAASGTPNVLLIVLDTVRSDSLGLENSRLEPKSPIARFARQGAIFESAWSTAPWTLPSQAGMFTGQLPHDLSGDWLSKLDGTHRTLAEELTSRGWSAGGFVANTRYCSEETGIARGFTHYEAYRFSWADVMHCSALGRKFMYSNFAVQIGWHHWPGRKRADEINASFLSWLDDRDSRPFFAFLNYWDAHDPYFASPEFAREAPATSRDKLLLRNWWWLTKDGLLPSDHDLARKCYEDCVAGLNQSVGVLLEELRSRGTLDNTLVIVTSDHGEHFGEHDLYLHGNSLYEPLLHVPLVVVWPEKVPAGVRVEAPVSLRGLPNTILDLLDLPPSFPGSSWVSHLDQVNVGGNILEPIHSELPSQAKFPPCHGRSPVAAGPMQCVRVGPLKYIRNGDGSEQLYQLVNDPMEQTNLVNDAAYADQLAILRSLLMPDSGESRQ